MPLRSLTMDEMPYVFSLEPLRGMSLRRLDMSILDAPFDLSPLADVRTESLIIADSDNLIGAEVLRGRDDIDIRGATSKVSKKFE